VVIDIFLDDLYVSLVAPGKTGTPHANGKLRRLFRFAHVALPLVMCNKFPSAGISSFLTGFPRPCAMTPVAGSVREWISALFDSALNIEICSE
jgi:hypothetical protein